jgi:hypothetical protein
MAFTSSQAFANFERAVRFEWRYRLDAEQHDFLAELLRSAENRVETIAADSLLYRAQVGCDWPETEEEEQLNPGPSGFAPSRMKPQRWRAADGRVNPRGIPYLYTATTELTAAAETRAWIGSYVSIAQLKTSRALRAVNCTTDTRPKRPLFHEPDESTWSDCVWSDIDRAFAAPADRDEHRAEYAATQIVAETFRKAGYDGVAYRSALSDGFNLALFDLEAADVLNCSVYEVTSLSFAINEVANRYFVTPKKTKPVDDPQ